jgi:twinkle protein
MADADKGAAFLDAMAKPRSIEPYSLRAKLEDLWDKGLPPGDPTGWRELDEFYTVAPGQFTVVTGWPSSGKSEWLDALLIHLSRQGWCFSIFSPENQPIELHSSKMLEKLAGKPFGRGPTERMKREEVGEHLDTLGRSFRFLEAPNDGGSLSVKDVIEAASPWLLKQERRGLVMDPWNELEHWRPSGLSETEYVSKTLSYVRNWARANKVHVWIVAHPQKMRDKNDQLPIPRPDMISGSQHWWNKADCAITIWRDLANPTGEVDVIVQKVRFKHIGKAGRITLNWDKPTGRYFEKPQLRSIANYYDADR